jgi:hypothetical protein
MTMRDTRKPRPAFSDAAQKRMVAAKGQDTKPERQLRCQPIRPIDLPAHFPLFFLGDETRLVAPRSRTTWRPIRDRRSQVDPPHIPITCRTRAPTRPHSANPIAFAVP